MWLRLRQIALIVQDVEKVVEDLEAVFGLEVAFIDEHLPPAYGLQNRLLPIGTQFLELCSPVRENTAGGRYLERRGGDGGYMVICQCDDHAPRKARVAELGIGVVAARDTETSCLMQLRPSDTRGSFLEIDWHERPDDEFPGWTHAIRGPWQDHIRTDRIKAIVAAEIQSPEPAIVANRWSEIIEEPLQQDANGDLSLKLENATLRFVPATDGRPEGLAGLVLVATNAEAARASAQKRGLLREVGTILFAGMRLRLA
jgi:hypothetical protein